jgi:hypothetical protein
MNSRRLKVSYRQPGSLVPLHRLSPMPFLRLQGRWLDQAGFAIGANVHVEVTPGDWCWKWWRLSLWRLP